MPLQVAPGTLLGSRKSRSDAETFPTNCRDSGPRRAPCERGHGVKGCERLRINPFFREPVLDYAPCKTYDVLDELKFVIEQMCILVRLFYRKEPT